MRMNQKQIAAAKDWIKDCDWADLTPDEVDELSDAQVERGVARHYSGGVAAFVRDCEPMSLIAA